MDKKLEKEVDNKSITRRRFFMWVWSILGIVALAEFVVAVIAFFRPGKKIKSMDMDSVLEAGHVDSFPLNSVTAFVQGKFYLCRMDDGGFIAVSRKCTHLGCTVPWLDKEKRFACPCHGSTFDIRGEVISPPAPRPLDRLPLFIENNMVKVDSGTHIKRGEFHKDQLVYPKRN